MIAANLALLGVFILLMLLGTPIAVALGLGGAVGVWIGLDANALAMIGTNTYAGIAKYPLIAIPLFILTGAVFERSGVARHLVEFAQSLIGPRRGGLALVAIVVCMIMGGMSGSGPADAAAVATVMLPSMVKAGYPRGFTASVVASSASTAILIPPSIAMIIYSVIVPGMDLRALFAAGLLPGLLLGVAIAVPTLLLSRHHDFGAGELPQRPPFWPSLWRAFPGLMAPVIILGGLRSGLFTPTETAVVAVAYGFFVGTVVYFHQSNISAVKGWAQAEMARGYPVYAALAIAAALFAGWACDRFGPERLLPVFLLPMALGVTLIGPAGQVGLWIAALGLLGATQGMASALWGALLPAVYGTRHLGAVRSLATTVMVVSTAIGPGITGILIDRGIDFPRQCLAMGIWCLGLGALGLVVLRRLRLEAAPRPVPTGPVGDPST